MEWVATKEGANEIQAFIGTDVEPDLLIRKLSADKSLRDIRRRVLKPYQRSPFLAQFSTSWVMMGLLIVLAVLATALGAIGIYAVLAQHVTANRREIGVRMALGAEPGKVVRGVVRSGLLLAGIGILIGSAGAAMATRFVEAMLFEVSALEPMAYVAPALALCVAAALAALVPAARAGSLPPAEVLRSE